MTVDIERLPINAPVMELRPEDGRTRVTFTRLAAIYYLQDDHPEQAAILEVLEGSRASGQAVGLTYDLKSKSISGVVDAG